MKNYFSMLGILGLVFALYGLPAASARTYVTDDGQSGTDAQTTEVRADTEERNEISAATTSARIEEDGDEERPEITWREERAEATSSDERRGGDEIKDEDRDEFEIDIELEDDAVFALSFDDLEQKIEERKLELEDEEASTTPKFREVVKNANEVRLAVHTLLASKELLGGLGPQVSAIAKAMNDSVATTTNIEAKVRSRGFLARLLFGGDSAAGEALAREVERNQQRIGELTESLGRATVSANIQTLLQAQLDALEEAQARLQELADKERNQWGLFSWRF